MGVESTNVNLRERRQVVSEAQIGNNARAGEPSGPMAEVGTPENPSMRILTLANAMYLSSWLNETVELPLDEDKFLEELNKRRATSRRKEDNDVLLDTEGTYGTK